MQVQYHHKPFREASASASASAFPTEDNPVQFVQRAITVARQSDTEKEAYVPVLLLHTGLSTVDCGALQQCSGWLGGGVFGVTTMYLTWCVGVFRQRRSFEMGMRRKSNQIWGTMSAMSIAGKWSTEWNLLGLYSEVHTK